MFERRSIMEITTGIARPASLMNISNETWKPKQMAVRKNDDIMRKSLKPGNQKEQIAKRVVLHIVFWIGPALIQPCKKPDRVCKIP